MFSRMGFDGLDCFSSSSWIWAIVCLLQKLTHFWKWLMRVCTYSVVWYNTQVLSFIFFLIIYQMNLSELLGDSSDGSLARWNHGGGKSQTQLANQHQQQQCERAWELERCQAPDSNRSFVLLFHLPLVVACGIFCGQCTDSVVVACRLSSCSLAVDMWDLVLPPGI